MSPSPQQSVDRLAAASTAQAATADPIVRVVNLHKSFGPLRVLAGMSLDFQRGHTTVVLRPSGTGKSVLLKHIVGLLRPDQGEVYYENQRIDQMNEHDLVAVRRKMGFLFQMGALFDSHSVGDNICFPLREHTKLSRSEREDRAAAVLRMVGLPGIQKKMPADLSGGQRKRVALARAIVLQPDLILYDEPTTGLDPITSDVINELIRSLAQTLGVTSIAVTHDMASARKIGDRMVLLHQGQVIADAGTEAFLALKDDRVQRFVQGRADEEDLQAIREGIQAR